MSDAAHRLEGADQGPGLTDARGWVPLNEFQQLMRRWTTLAPYNAAQVVEVSGPADVQRWHDAAQLVLTQTGLGRPEADATGENVHFTPATLGEIARFCEQEEPDALRRELTRQLNAPFNPNELPVRMFVVGNKGERGESHQLAAVYDHWIADSRAMRALMQRIVAAYQGAQRLAMLPALTIKAPSYREAYTRLLHGMGRMGTVLESARNFLRYRMAYRVNLRDTLDFHSELVLHTLPEGLIETVHRAARRRQASVNDAFLAALAQAMGALTAGARYKKRKRKLHLPRRLVGLGTIVDIRDASGVPLEDVFGLYLGNYTVQVGQPERRELGELVRGVAQRTKRVKQRNAAVRGLPALRTAIAWWDAYKTPRHRAEFLHKNAPVVAGISNVNMTGSWADPNVLDTSIPLGMPRVLDYLRISPTGPLLPLVFTLTTLGRRLSLCVTYRTTAYTAEQVAAVIAGFEKRLEAFV